MIKIMIENYTGIFTETEEIYAKYTQEMTEIQTIEEEEEEEDEEEEGAGGVGRGGVGVVVKEGWLGKKSEKRKKFVKRWFVVRYGWLSYFNSPGLLFFFSFFFLFSLFFTLFFQVPQGQLEELSLLIV